MAEHIPAIGTLGGHVYCCRQPMHAGTDFVGCAVLTCSSCGRRERVTRQKWIEPGPDGQPVYARPAVYDPYARRDRAKAKLRALAGAPIHEETDDDA